MRHIRLPRGAAGLLVAALLVLPTCDPGESAPQMKVRIGLYGPPSDYPDPFEEVAFLRVTADGEGIASTSTFMAFSEKSGVLPEVPYGDAVQITVEALKGVCRAKAGFEGADCSSASCNDPSQPCEWGPGEVVSRGRTGHLTIAEDSEPRTVTVYMTRVATYAPTTSASTLQVSELATGRIGHSATVLEDGTVLVVGGATLADGGPNDFTDPAALGTIFRTAEIFDPMRGDFIAISTGAEESKLLNERAFHQAVRIPNPNGPDRIAIFGGYGRINGTDLQPLSTVEIYDPTTQTFSQSVPPMQIARAYHTATLDGNGRVLLVGGRGDAALSWELWDPSLGTIGGGALGVPRWNHTTTYVPGSQPMIYVFGGENDQGATDRGELYSPIEDKFLNGVLPMRGPEGADTARLQPRTLHTTNFVAGQNLMYVIGGYEDGAKTRPLNRVDVYQVNCPLGPGETLDKCWRGDVGFSLYAPRGGHTTVEMPGNALLVTGGCASVGDAECGVVSSEVIFQYDEVKTNEQGQQYIEHSVKIGFSPDPLWPRFLHQALLLDNREVLLIGGARRNADGQTILANSELFNPL